MTTKEQLVEALKLEFPTLRIGDDVNGYSNLSAKEYEITIKKWADGKFEKIARQAEAETKAAAKAAAQAKLAALGLTVADLEALGL